MRLTRIVYFSTNNMPADIPAAETLKRILASAIRNNTRLDVTGGLVFNRDHFLQVLEGDRAAVSKLFAAISNDPRHSQIELVETKLIEQRQFGAWSMGFAAKSELIKQAWAKFAIQGGFNPELLTADQMVALILELVRNEDRFVSSEQLAAS